MRGAWSVSFGCGVGGWVRARPSVPSLGTASRGREGSNALPWVTADPACIPARRPFMPVEGLEGPVCARSHGAAPAP
ncbi:hypothetical protein GCM10010358_19650 [Streptomyces minutiscleroticus]|uniref:Uncharacterized protein n=1 Tax=Streptomyces minutiscleroticus TaxID=68238 RepID=A0A918NDX5_9ACTN|nr:hypothetical protein GCM10010358_19650 [Streptomyces minutiscleroticus]